MSKNDSPLVELLIFNANLSVIEQIVVFDSDHLIKTLVLIFVVIQSVCIMYLSIVDSKLLLIMQETAIGSYTNTIDKFTFELRYNSIKLLKTYLLIFDLR